MDTVATESTVPPARTDCRGSPPAGPQGVLAPVALPDDHPLRTHPRAIVTPHMSFYSEEAQAELEAAEERWLELEALREELEASS